MTDTATATRPSMPRRIMEGLLTLLALLVVFGPLFGGLNVVLNAYRGSTAFTWADFLALPLSHQLMVAFFHAFFLFSILFITRPKSDVFPVLSLATFLPAWITGVGLLLSLW